MYVFCFYLPNNEVYKMFLLFIVVSYCIYCTYVTMTSEKFVTHATKFEVNEAQLQSLWMRIILRILVPNYTTNYSR